jgi:hypothetical protein
VLLQGRLAVRSVREVGYQYGVIRGVRLPESLRPGEYGAASLR